MNFYKKDNFNLLYYLIISIVTSIWCAPSIAGSTKLSNAPSEQNFINLDDYRVFSILYSSSAGEALVGVIEPKTNQFGQDIIAFAECDAPRGAENNSIVKSALVNCYLNRSSRLIASDDNIKRLMDGFKLQLNENYKHEYKLDVENSTYPSLMLFGSLATGLISYEQIRLLISLWSKEGLALRLGRTGFAAFTFLSSMGALYMGAEMLYRSNKPAPSLESSILSKYEELFNDANVEVKPIHFTNEDYILTYQLIKTSLFQSIFYINFEAKNAT